MFQTRPMITEDVPDSADGYRKCSRLCRGLPKLSQTRSILYDKTDSTSILVLWLADMYILMHPVPYVFLQPSIIFFTKTKNQATSTPLIEKVGKGL